MPTTTNTTAKTDSRDKTDAELIELIRPIVSDYVSSSRNKCWAMVEAAYKVKASLGEGPNTIGKAIDIFRDCLKFEYKRSMPDFEEDSTYIYDCKLIEKCVKVAYTFEEKELAKKRESKSFNEIYADVPKPNSKKKKGKAISASQYAKAMQADADAGVVNADRYVADIKEGIQVNGLEMKPGKESKNWIDPKVSGKRTNKTFDDDDWREESLTIISDQFDRFLAMIKQALEKELVGSKRQQLKELIQ